MPSQWLELEVDKISGDPETRGCNLGNLNSPPFSLRVKPWSVTNKDEDQFVTKQWPLGPVLENALKWTLELILVAPPRSLSTHKAKPTCLLYTDGSSEAKRENPHYVGAVLFVPDRKLVLYIHCAVPDDIVSAWLPAKQYIHLVELFAGPVALDTWSNLLEDRHVIHFCDNSAALGALVKGYSPSGDLLHMAGDYWLRCAKLKCCIFIDRVESKSNIADEPSRPDLPNTVLDKLGAVYTPPVVSYISSHSARVRPSRWLGEVDIQRVINTLESTSDP